MIHYHGLPITPEPACYEAIVGGHAFVSFRHRQQIQLAKEICQSFAIDNGAFSAWKSGAPIADWSPFYEWVESLRRHPGFDFAVIPDVIDGDEDANDQLVMFWPFPTHIGAPVWHMHESIERLVRLCNEWPRVAFGSSGEYAVVGNAKWRKRMDEAFSAICVEGEPIAKIHGLRMLNPAVFTKIPLASADSTNIGRNVGVDQNWRGTYQPANKVGRARVMRDRIEAFNSAPIWTPSE